MDEDKLRFRTLWIAQPGKDYQQLHQFADELRFITNGFETDADRAANIAEAVRLYDPEVDAWIPVGLLVTSVQFAAALVRRYPGRPIHIGLWLTNPGKYIWREL